MKSFMAITKSAAFRYMLLLHFFLKVKMCVGFVDAAADAASDSDINYEESDEWLEEMTKGASGRAGGLLSWAPSQPVSSTSIPASSNLMRWEGGPDGHAGHRSRMHHVRHEQHYLKHRPMKVANPSDKTMMALDSGGYQAHTVTTSIVTGPDHQQKSRHHSHHQHQQHHHHQQYHKHVRKSDPDMSGEELDLVGPRHRAAEYKTILPSQERRHWLEQIGSNEASNMLSSGRGSQDSRLIVLNRKRSASSFHSLTSNALPDTGSSSRDASSGRISHKAAQKSINPQSKYYFEELLNNYKSSSPYYKELHQASYPQPKALALGRRNQQSTAEAAKSIANSKSILNDGDLDYLYDDETDDSVQNDDPSSGTVSTSTRAPSTTTATTTTTPTTNTTPRSIVSWDESDESSGIESNDGTSEGDTSYSTYVKKVYAMGLTPRRSGNNRYNSIASPSPPPSPPRSIRHNQQHNQHGSIDRIDPAKQVRYPERYESLTDYKQANFGNKLAVERSYNAYSNNGYARQQVMSHLQRINVEGRCKVPKPKLVPSSLDRSKVYMPHCTILHRCEDDTGCCMPMETCAAKTTTNITLYFYMGNIGSRQQHTVTTLTFSNHTECHCVRLDALHGLRSSRSQTQVESSLEHSTEGSGGYSGIAPASRCTCPRHFKAVYDNDSNCFCDCLSHDRDCIRFKEGFENFSMETRKCIRSKQCNVPRCEYGMYNRNEGRCPKKSDRINEQFPQYR